MRWLSSLVLCTACVTAKPAPEPAPPPAPPPVPTARPNAVRARATPFDVSVCAPAVSFTPLMGALQELLEYERARFEACLATPGSRDKADASADVNVTVSIGGAAVSVTPRDVTPEGVACLEAAAKRLTLTAAPKQVLTGTLVVAPPPGAPDPAVVLLPEVNALRAAVTQACACFEVLGTNAPPQLVLRVSPSTAVDVVTSADPLAAKLERCLEEQLAAHPRPSVELTVDLPLLHSGALQLSPDATPEIAEQQQQALARRRVALVKLLSARRAALVSSLDALATKLERKPTPALMKERRALCGTLFEVDDALPPALEAAKDTELAKSISVAPLQTCAAVKRTSAQAE
ncbi:MAG: hypothetical protein JNJ54_31265 [Myxococcaceae bacterium]|nr:hypothetical protein [Myxococcaceae bacterium]